jgi:lysosomal Pro-X carboxypeptidase
LIKYLIEIKTFRKFSSSESGRSFLNSKLKLCSFNKIQKFEDWKQFYDFADYVIYSLSMSNYPYPAKFIKSLPANPVKEFCIKLSNPHLSDEDLIPAFGDAIQIFTNYSGDSHCVGSANFKASSSSWEFQRCTQKIAPMCKTGENDMFLPEPWNFTQYSDECYKMFGIRPREKAVITRYMSQNWDFASNIIFTNGLLDPWSGAGLLRSFNKKIDVILIPEGAHHIDLRADDPLDPKSVRLVREFHLKKFRKWINDFAINFKNRPKTTF